MEIFIKLEDNSCHSTVSVDDDASPTHIIKQDAVYDLTVKFVQGGVQVELPPDTEGRLYLRPTETDGVPHVVTGPWTKSGTGSSAAYAFTCIVVGSALSTALTTDPDGKRNYDAEVEWIDPASPSLPQKSIGHICDVRRAVGTASAAATTAARTARTLDVADNFASLNAMGYNAYGSLQDAVDAALLLTPTTIAPVTIRLHNRADDGFSTSATSMEWVHIVGMSVNVSTVSEIILTHGSANKMSLANMRVVSLRHTLVDPAASLTIKVDQAFIEAVHAYAKDVRAEGNGRIQSINTDGNVAIWGSTDAGDVQVYGSVLVDYTSQAGENNDPDLGDGGDLIINDWCKVGSSTLTGGSSDGTLTNNSLW